MLLSAGNKTWSSKYISRRTTSASQALCLPVNTLTQTSRLQLHNWTIKRNFHSFYYRIKSSAFTTTESWSNIALWMVKNGFKSSNDNTWRGILLGNKRFRKLWCVLLLLLAWWRWNSSSCHPALCFSRSLTSTQTQLYHIAEGNKSDASHQRVWLSVARHWASVYISGCSCRWPHWTAPWNRECARLLPTSCHVNNSRNVQPCTMTPSSPNFSFLPPQLRSEHEG